MRRKLLQYLYIALVCLTFTSCGESGKKYVIGVALCSEDSWRPKLQAELEQAAYFNEDVELRFLTADNNAEEQRRQIQQFVDDGVDLLILSPQQTSNLADAIVEVRKRNIPVILFDRKSGIEDFTAYMAADNYSIGQLVGEYVCSQLGYKGNIVEIAGEQSSTPASDRHKGFVEVVSRYPDLHIVGFAEGNWNIDSGAEAMNTILAEYNGRIDCVFGGNDRMAIGARDALEKYQQMHHETVNSAKSILFMGVDALPIQGGGIEQISAGNLTASAIYPTHGDEMMNLALAILKGEHYEKDNMLSTTLVTEENANLLLMQNKQFTKLDDTIKRLQQHSNSLQSMQTQRQTLLVFAVISVAVIIILVVALVRARRRLNAHKPDSTPNE